MKAILIAKDGSGDLWFARAPGRLLVVFLDPGDGGATFARICSGATTPGGAP